MGKSTVNKNCMLARNGIFPYERCDHCKDKVTACTGMQYNVIMLFIAILLMLFLFISNPVFIRFNITAIIIAVILMGYLVMRNTDRLALANTENIKLNKRLSNYSTELETEVAKQTKQLRELASNDPLTKLFNRHTFEMELTKTFNQTKVTQEAHVVCYADLDQFKLVNDTSGHVAGDELLRQLSSLLKETLQEGDILARLGGDEFGFIFKNCTIEEAKQRATLILNTITGFRFSWEEKLFSVGISMGLVAISKECISVQDLMVSADMACYSAKENGRNRFHVFEMLDIDIVKHKSDIEWVTEVESALEENRFILFGQPIVSLLHPDKPHHFELLVRMESKNGDIIQPMAFIPAAERYGKIQLIDRWVINQAFTLQKELHQQGLDFNFSINLSGNSLGDDELEEYIVTQFIETEIPHSSICFEITETATISNLNNALHFIKKFRALGCKFSLDDFGSGLSSFAYLKNIPVDFLKIDGQFVRDIDTNLVNREMVIAIDKIAKVMGIQTICEFVENDHVLSTLAHLDIDFAQGHHFCVPKHIKECIDAACSLEDVDA